MTSFDENALENALNERDGNDSTLLSRPAVALLAAGAIGFAVGAVVWRYRRTHPEKFASIDRAVELARSGAADSFQKLQRRLRNEGYSPGQIERRAKKYLSQMMQSAQRSR
ncbi:MAG: hypothetical protein QM780_06610 [Hyphomicrobium sp.]|uniref:hypothetical protein n=1 Tax=Hyphomicrobium sp. TaxID=82 RepID=UPI0039E3BD3D